MVAANYGSFERLRLGSRPLGGCRCPLAARGGSSQCRMSCVCRRSRRWIRRSLGSTGPFDCAQRAPAAAHALAPTALSERRPEKTGRYSANDGKSDAPRSQNGGLWRTSCYPSSTGRQCSGRCYYQCNRCVRVAACFPKTTSPAICSNHTDSGNYNGKYSKRNSGNCNNAGKYRYTRSR